MSSTPSESRPFVFPPWTNLLPPITGAAAVLVLGGIVFAFWYYGTPKHLDVGYQPPQPVPYSHQLHAGQLGLDCRYCHANVERSWVASVPPTQVCMGCHASIKKDSPYLAPVRQSWATGQPVPWIRIHKSPDYVYFDHSRHVSRGVGCVECHGRVDTMERVRQVEPLSMGWCLECHRDPAPRLRPVEFITR
ncbi:MAG: cytochrome c family protein, partial [Myxococcota bacterium]|nr:cytochrome c family protein [Myxococcota bacterium]